MTSGSNITSGFIDLATFDEIEKYMYGGSDSYAYFVRETKKSTWFTQVPALLTNVSGLPAFGNDVSYKISRAGDYLLYTWLRVLIPEVVARAFASDGDGNPTVGTFGAGTRIGWVHNLMHNLVESASLAFNDLKAEEFDSYFLDFWSHFTVTASKRFAYDNMIGNISWNQSNQDESTVAANGVLESRWLNLPLPFFFSRDSGVALPTAVLPYNDMIINIKFRRWEDLLFAANIQQGFNLAPVDPAPFVPYYAVPSTAANGDITAVPALTQVQMWANYALVSSEERAQMACAPRDILIEQVQVAPRMSFAPATNPNPRYDIRFSHAIKVLFFAVRNTTYNNVRSNYTAAIPNGGSVIETNPQNNGDDPIQDVSIVYENTSRLTNMGVDYFALVNPFYHAPVVGPDTGLHQYSYSLSFIDIDPHGSTNFGKLTNISIAPTASATAIIGANGSSTVAQSGLNVASTYEFVAVGVNNNIIRVSGGAMGFPVL